MQRLLDDFDTEADELVQSRVGDRGVLSLEHAFRLLTLVLEPTPVRLAFKGILQDNEKLRSISLEFLEHVLPKDIRQKLWPFIGDISDHQREPFPLEERTVIAQGAVGCQAYIGFMVIRPKGRMPPRPVMPVDGQPGGPRSG